MIEYYNKIFSDFINYEVYKTIDGYILGIFYNEIIEDLHLNYLYIENTFRKNKGKYKKSYYYKSLKRESIRLSKKYKNKYIDSQKYKYQLLDVEVENEFGMKKFKDYKMKKQEKNYREDKLKEQKQLFNPIELRLIQLITTGFTFEEAAEEIGISSDNARKMKCNIYSKINKRICS